PSGAEAAPVHSGPSGLSRPIPHSRRVLRPYGAARRSARDRRSAARAHPSGRAERSAVAQPRAPRTLPVGTAAGGRRDEMSCCVSVAGISTPDLTGNSSGVDEQKTLLTRLPGAYGWATSVVVLVVVASVA